MDKILVEQLTKQNEYHLNEALKWQERAQDLACKIVKLETQIDELKKTNEFLNNELQILNKELVKRN